MSGLRFAALTGGDALARLDDLAGLRIAVFREWPYLYDGTRSYEARYLRDFAAAPDALIVCAFDGERIVGASTACPLKHESPNIRAPFEAAGIDMDPVFYFGESVLLPAWRGQGAGHRFFDLRETHARNCGAERACFSAVVRAEDDPRRPIDHHPLNGFWHRRGYDPAPGLTCAIAWAEIGSRAETPKTMQIWMRTL